MCLQVKASIFITEADEVQKGIVNLVNLHSIRKLVVGAIPEYVFTFSFVASGLLGYDLTLCICSSVYLGYCLLHLFL